MPSSSPYLGVRSTRSLPPSRSCCGNTAGKARTSPLRLRASGRPSPPMGGRRNDDLRHVRAGRIRLAPRAPPKTRG
eukprot:12512912-Alexandrium_andersonii.AAC.1